MRCRPSGHSPSQTVAVWQWQGVRKKDGRATCLSPSFCQGQVNTHGRRCNTLNYYRTELLPEKRKGAPGHCVFSCALHIYQAVFAIRGTKASPWINSFYPVVFHATDSRVVVTASPWQGWELPKTVWVHCSDTNGTSCFRAEPWERAAFL